MSADRTIAAAAEATSAPIPRAQAVGRSCGVDRHPVRAAVRHTVGDAAPGNGLRLGHELLAPSARLAGSRRLGPTARGSASQAARGRPHRLVTRHRRFFLHSRRGIGSKTGPNPTDRARPGSKHHLVTEAQGIPLALILTGATGTTSRNCCRSSMPSRRFEASAAGRCPNRPSCKAIAATITTNTVARYTPQASGLKLLAEANRTATALAKPDG